MRSSREVLRNVGAVVTLTAAVLGPAACSAASSTSPNRPPGATSTAGGNVLPPLPSCTLSALPEAVAPHNQPEDFSVTLRDAEAPGLYAPSDVVDYTFGDHESDPRGSEINELHTYTESGTYDATATIKEDTAPGVRSPVGAITCSLVVVVP